MLLHGSITVTATNSDKLTSTYIGSCVPVGGTLLQTKNVTYSFTGSTGRFECARGTGQANGSEVLATHHGR